MSTGQRATADDPLRYAHIERPAATPIGNNPACFTAAACKAIKAPRALIGIGEGEKRAIAISQCGIPCIGLAGADDWHVKRAAEGKKAGDWELIPDLATIDWAGRIVLLFPDTDVRRNPSVNKAFAELARILTAHGAIVQIIRLPIGPRSCRRPPGYGPG